MLLHTSPSIIMHLRASTAGQYFFLSSIRLNVHVCRLSNMRAIGMPNIQTFSVADFCVEDGEIRRETFSEMLIDWQRAKRLALSESTYCTFL